MVHGQVSVKHYTSAGIFDDRYITITSLIWESLLDFMWNDPILTSVLQLMLYVRPTLCIEQGCSLNLERLCLVFLRLVYIELQSSKFKLRTITIKILYSLQRYLGCLSFSVENRHFCLFLNYELFNIMALKNMNVMDVIKA